MSDFIKINENLKAESYLLLVKSLDDKILEVRKVTHLYIIDNSEILVYTIKDFIMVHPDIDIYSLEKNLLKEFSDRRKLSAVNLVPLLFELIKKRLTFGKFL